MVFVRMFSKEFCAGGGFCPGGGGVCWGVLSRGVLFKGYCPGGFVRGILSGGFYPGGGVCPGVFCPRGGFVHRAGATATTVCYI